MPWREMSVMDEKREFVHLMQREGANRRELCRRFGISATVGYKWLGRWQAEGDAGLAERSRRPRASPGRSSAAVEARVLAVREAHPAWGARKIARVLERAGEAVPAVSTVHESLRRHGRVGERRGGPAGRWQRFEKPAANELWQMDFKGWVRLADGARCHPLTMVDDHSRYALCVEACGDERRLTVQSRLEGAFRRYGLPEAIYVDNGSPWGDAGGARWTGLGVWLLKLGVAVVHSRPYRPQGRGKNERFHRTLKDEVFALRRLRDLAETQRAFDAWRTVYNLERPHEGLAMEVPASRYTPSARTMPERLAAIEYDAGEIVRTVPETKDYISFKGRRWLVPRAFRGERVAIRPRGPDGHYLVCFGAHPIAEIDLTGTNGVSDVSEHL